jgi:hypothetical protein
MRINFPRKSALLRLSNNEDAGSLQPNLESIPVERGRYPNFFICDRGVGGLPILKTGGVALLCDIVKTMQERSLRPFAVPREGIDPPSRTRIVPRANH